MDGVRLPGHGKELPKDDGLSRSLGPGSDPQWLEICHPTGGGVVTWARTAAFNFQLRSGHPPHDARCDTIADIIHWQTTPKGPIIGGAKGRKGMVDISGQGKRACRERAMGRAVAP